MKVNFICEQISLQGDKRRVILSPIRDTAIWEDQPIGNIDFQNVDPTFASQFSIGQTYEISINPVK